MLAYDNGTTGSASGGDPDQQIYISDVSFNAITPYQDNDTVYGGAGDDIIDGGDGNDALYGEAGNDTLTGGAGADIIDGGTGTDTASYAGSSAGVQVNLQANTATGGDAAGDVLSNIENLTGSAFNDTLTGDAGNNVLKGLAGNDTLNGGAGDDTLSGGLGNDTLNGGTGTDTADFSDSATGVTVQLGGNANGSATGQGTDVLTSIENVTGSAQADTITGDVFNNVLSGGGGNDTLNGGSGQDTLIGGAGADTLIGGVGSDTADYSASAAGVNVSLVTGTGTGGDAQGDTLSGIENLTGSAQADTLTGNDSANILTGGDGDDTITGGYGGDTISGGAGNDTIIAGPDTAPTVTPPAAANLRLDWDAQAPSGSNIEAGFTQTVGGVMNVGVTYSETDPGSSFTIDYIPNVSNDQTIYSTSGDTATGGTFDTGSSSVLYRPGGPGQVQTTLDFSAVSGSGLTNQVSNVRFRLSDIDVGNFIDQVTVFAYDASGNAVPVTITETSSWLTVSGNTVTATGGNTSPDTSTGSALYVINGPVSQVVIQYIDAANSNAQQAIWVSDVHFTTIPVADAGDNDYVDGGDGDDFIAGGIGNDTLLGGAGNDTLNGGTGNDTLDGGAGDDTLIGGAGADQITGGTGTDTADYSSSTAGAINVTLSGGPGTGGDAQGDVLTGVENLIGTSGNDTLTGDGANNVISGGAGNDTISGGAGNDTLLGGLGNDTISGGDGNDTIDGGDGADIITGGAGNDTIQGGAGADNIQGNAGDDTIDGGTGNDTIDGGTGNDILAGGTGDDTVLGGAGVDQITVGLGDDEVNAGDDTDTIIITNNGTPPSGSNVDGGSGVGTTADFDTLDLTAWGKALTTIVFDPNDPEDGTVFFLDGSGNTIGSMTFFDIENVIPCFTPGTLVETDEGPVLVEDLMAGDRVLTRDSGYCAIRWTGRRDLTAVELACDPSLRPVLIAAGAMGQGLPERDMMVSPQHRMLFCGPRAEILFGEAEVLVAAIHLVGLPGISRQSGAGVSYVHLMFDRHEILRADGAWSESFQPGERTIGAMEEATRAELLTLFPALATGACADAYPAARISLKAHEARAFLAA